MKINPQALERLKAAAVTAGSLAAIFEQMGEAFQLFGTAYASFGIDFQGDADVEEDDLIPVITLTLRPATPNDRPDVDVPPEPTPD